MSRHTLSSAPGPVLRRCACGAAAREEECPECRAKGALRRHGDAPAALLHAPRQVHEVLRSGGAPLDAATRSWAERGFGHSFAQVRVHADGAAARSAEAVAARAYAAGEHVVFGAGRFAPHTAPGRRLMAHELAHVAQQRHAPGSVPARLAIGRVDAPEEREADAAAAAVLRGETARVEAAPPALARESEDGKEPVAGPADLAEVTATGPGAPVVFEAGAGAGADAGTAPPARSTRARQVEDAGAAQDATAGNQLATMPTPGKVAGYTGPKPKAVFSIAWTMDDGPTPFSDPMRKKLTGIPLTWFVMREMIRQGAGTKKNLARLAQLVAGGDEVAIHSFHPTDASGHICFFPAPAVRCRKGFSSMTRAMAELVAFKGELNAAGLTVKFVRPPTGLHDEMVAYLSAAKAKLDPEATFRAIVAAQNARDPLKGLDAGAQEVEDDFDLLLATLKANGLHLWGGGDAGKPEVTGNDWEAESSGVPARADTLHATFNTMLNGVKAGKRTKGSLVILAHDTSQADVDHVAADVAEMEKLAVGASVRLEYYTESQLYRVVRGTPP